MGRVARYAIRENSHTQIVKRGELQTRKKREGTRGEFPQWTTIATAHYEIGQRVRKGK